MARSGSVRCSQGKAERHKRLMEILAGDPFVTDRELAERLGVSVQTIRLDRLEMGIPEARERIKQLAEEAYSKVRAVGAGEVVGELIHVRLGQEGMSILDTSPEMSFSRTRIVRGHHIFAQANSLAVAIVDAEVALTGSATVRFRRPVYAGDRLIASARITSRDQKRYGIQVTTRVGDGEVFSGDFVVFDVSGGTSGISPTRMDE